MEKEQLVDLVRAYRGGLTADIVQARHDVGGKWGPVFAVPRCSPDALALAGRQFTRGGAVAVRHARRALLRGPSSCTDVVVVTEVPNPHHQQTVVRMEDGVTLQVHTYLHDAALAALEAAFAPARR